MTPSLITLIERLTGQKVPLPENLPFVTNSISDTLNLGYSQFNELLLLLGYDRINNSFFQFLSGSEELSVSATIQDLELLNTKIDKSIEYCLRLFGNIKFGYKRLSQIENEEEFIYWVEQLSPGDAKRFSDRHPPLIKFEKIQNDETYLLGYIIQRDIEDKLAVDPEDQDALKMKSEMTVTIEKGKKNHRSYLASDHMDVYVATSMRQRHEYLFVSRIADQIFNMPQLKSLNVRYFDPTQAYCSDRIDKGISEALMLKRAKCTIYLAQEADTLGKDSELASTLAQGKTVIAYVPIGDKAYVDELLADLATINNDKSPKDLVIDQLMIFAPELAWREPVFRRWLENDSENQDYGLDLLYKVVSQKYDSRAKTLKDTHPLGIQVNLETGVANGVIVTRDAKECADLIQAVLTGTLQFKVSEIENQGIPYTLLKEKITESVYRVSTGEMLLVNAFWNYYLPTK